MNITKNFEGTNATLAIDGWLDTQSAPMLKAALDELPAETAALTLDLEKLEYISSAGLRQLVAAHSKMHGNLLLTNVPAAILDILRMAGFDKRLHIG